MAADGQDPVLSLEELTKLVRSQGLFLEKIVLTAGCNDAKTLSRLDRVSRLFHARKKKMRVEDDDGNDGATVENKVSLVERALRLLSEQAGRGVRGVALPPTVAGPPLPNWTQVLLRELRRGFWRKLVTVIPNTRAY
eukprot:g4427.t1